MKLIFPENNEEVLDIINRIKSMSLAFTKEEVPDAKEVALKVDGDLHEGLKGVHEYLDMISNELDQWHYCHC